jgi:hypothetical protein
MKEYIILSIATMAFPISPSPGTGTGHCKNGVQIEDVRNTYIRPMVSNLYPSTKKNKVESIPTTYTLIPTKWIKVK